MESPDTAPVLLAETLAHRTWPCREEEAYGAWTLRAADGYSRRANSALAIGEPPHGIDAALDQVTRWYESREIEPCVKITPLASASLLDALVARKWTVATPSLVLRKSGEKVAKATRDPNVSWTTVVSDEWFEPLSTWDEELPEQGAHHRALLERMPHPRFAVLRDDGHVAGALVASVDGDQAHLYDLVVDPILRGKGAGSAFFGQILSDLFQDGIAAVTLQVLETNEVARRLYQRTGFVEVHRYHYRVPPCEDGEKSSFGC